MAEISDERDENGGSTNECADGERARLHEAYARLGRLGGEKGGQIRREQMARGEIFARKSRRQQASQRQNDQSERSGT